MKTQEIVGFELSTSARNDGTIEAIYISFSPCGKVARTEEIHGDILLADYDDDDKLIGLEILAPVKISELAKLVEGPKRAPFKKFVRSAAPHDFVLN